MAEDNKLVELAREGAQGLKRVRDEINLRIHLGGMEATDAWGALQERVQRLEQALQRLGERMQSAGEQAEVQLHLGILEAQERWAEIESQLARLLDELERGAQAAKRTVERMRVQAHLGRREAEEEVQPLLERARARLERLGAAAADESASALGRLVEAVRALGVRVGALERRDEPGGA